MDSPFDDGATARGIANLPQGVNDYLKELSTQAKAPRWAACTQPLAPWAQARATSLSAWLYSASSSSQLACPSSTQWHASSWLQHEGIYDAVRSHVEKSGFDWNEELDNFYVAEGLHEALVKAKPNLFTSPASCVETLNNLYPMCRTSPVATCSKLFARR